MHDQTSVAAAPRPAGPCAGATSLCQHLHHRLECFSPCAARQGMHTPCALFGPRGSSPPHSRVKWDVHCGQPLAANQRDQGYTRSGTVHTPLWGMCCPGVYAHHAGRLRCPNSRRHWKRVTALREVLCQHQHQRQGPWPRASACETDAKAATEGLQCPDWTMLCGRTSRCYWQQRVVKRNQSSTQDECSH